MRKARASPQDGLLALDCGQNHSGKSFLNSHSSLQPWSPCCSKGVVGFSGAPLCGQCWQRDRSKALCLKSFLLRWECLIRSGPPPGPASHFQEGLIHASRSLKEKWDGVFSCGGWHLQFLFWNVWRPGPNCLPLSLFQSTLLLSAYCVPSRKQVRGYQLSNSYCGL